MATQVTNYQCPACTGPLRYDAGTGTLVCDYCGQAYRPKEIEQHYAQQLQQAEQAAVDALASEAETASASVWQEDESYTADETWNPEQEGMKLYQCPSCGAQLVCDRTTAATSCPYCGNPSVIPGQFHGTLRPDYILPFRLSREEALDALKKYYKGKKLLPRRFTEENHLEEMKGIYVPFWLFDGRAVADMHYHATRVMTAQHGDEMITTTDHYDVRRAGSVRFTRIPADGSQKMPDELMDSIEPFDYSDLKPFSTAYMPGFYADIYDVDDRKSFERARIRGTHSAEQIMDETVSGYSSVTPTRKQVQMYREKTAYALLPVWMLNTSWNGKQYLFSMNGQTGKFVGDLPVSTGRYLAWLAGIAAPLAALLALLLH